jgi:WD40 repeat protein
MQTNLVFSFLVGFLAFRDCLQPKSLNKLNNFPKESSSPLNSIRPIESSKIDKITKTIYNASSPVLALDSIHVITLYYLACGCADGTIKLWNLANGLLVTVIEAHIGPITSLYFDPVTLNLISAGKDKLIKVWSTDNFALIRVLIGHHDTINVVTYFYPHALYKRNPILSASNDLTMKIWDQNNGSLIKTIGKFNSPVVSLQNAFCDKSGKTYDILFTGDNEGIISAWVIDDWSLLYKINAHKGAVLDFLALVVGAPSPSKPYFYLFSTGLDKKVNSWTYDFFNFSLNKTFVGQTDVVTKLELCTNDCLCLTGSYDKTIILWDLDTGKIMKTLNGHFNKVLSLTTSTYNATLISGDADGLIINWNVS